MHACSTVFNHTAYDRPQSAVLIVLPSLLLSVCHHSAQEICSRKNNPSISWAQTREQHKWKNVKGICVAPRQPQFLISFSRATLSKALWGTYSSLSRKASTYLYQSEPHQSLLCSRTEIGRYTTGHRKCVRFNLDSHDIGNMCGACQAECKYSKASLLVIPNICTV